MNIDDIILKSYGMLIYDKFPISLGHNQCFLARSDSGKIFIKIYPDGELKSVRNEVGYITLISKSFCVPKLIATKSGEYYYIQDKEILLCEWYEDGQVYNYNECPDVILNKSANLLAVLHNVSKTITHHRVLDYEWIVNFRRREILTLHRVIRLLASDDEVNSQAIIEEIEAKLDMYKQTEQYIEEFKLLEYGMSHGDYCSPQWITNNNKITCVVDFANCAEIPYIWEIFRSYLQSAKECKNGAINIDNLINYLHQYHEIRKINISDLLYMPEIFCCWLSSSSYGYKQYLDTKDSKMLKTAKWRTMICASVLNMKDEIQERILSEFK